MNELNIIVICLYFCSIKTLIQISLEKFSLRSHRLTLSIFIIQFYTVYIAYWCDNKTWNCSSCVLSVRKRMFCLRKPAQRDTHRERRIRISNSEIVQTLTRVSGEPRPSVMSRKVRVAEKRRFIRELRIVIEPMCVNLLFIIGFDVFLMMTLKLHH